MATLLHALNDGAPADGCRPGAPGSRRLPPQSLASFPGDFREGMAARAAAHLGETGRGLPPHGPADPPFAARGVHALLLISARDRDEMERRHTAVAAVAFIGGLLFLVDDVAVPISLTYFI